MQFKQISWRNNVLHPTRRHHAICSELPRNYNQKFNMQPNEKTLRNLLVTSAQPYKSNLHVVFNGCAEVPSKLRQVFFTC